MNLIIINTENENEEFNDWDKVQCGCWVWKYR